MLVCYGEALVDLIVSAYQHGAMTSPAQACLGGSVFNCCIAAARQGLPTSYLNPLSCDAFGQQFAQLLQRENVHLASTPSALPTAMAVVQLDASGKASYSFHREAVADRDITAADAIARLPASARWLHTGCLMLVPQDWPRTRELLRAARAKGLRISVDANLRLSVGAELSAYRAAVLEACRMADVVKVSDDDLIALGLDGAPAQAARSLLGEHTAFVALTLGAQGAVLMSREQDVSCPAPPGIAVVDTVGAGDSFMAALLAWCIHEANWPKDLVLNAGQMQQALEHAVHAASLCVAKQGCDPASWQETVDHVLRRAR
jgi:fructokinase